MIHLNQCSRIGWLPLHHIPVPDVRVAWPILVCIFHTWQHTYDQIHVCLCTQAKFDNFHVQGKAGARGLPGPRGIPGLEVSMVEITHWFQFSKFFFFYCPMLFFVSSFFVLSKINIICFQGDEGPIGPAGPTGLEVSC